MQTEPSGSLGADETFTLLCGGLRLQREARCDRRIFSLVRACYVETLSRLAPNILTLHS